MNLRIVPVTEENRAEAERLHVAKNQEHFIETVEECLQEADTLADWEPVCVYDGQTMVGFSMYGYIREENPRVWFDRLLIDMHYQKHGYGRRTVKEMLNRIQKEFPGKDIYISAYEENKAAISLYQSFGFHTNGELDINGEKVMVLEHK